MVRIPFSSSEALRLLGIKRTPTSISFSKFFKNIPDIISFQLDAKNTIFI
jgi:hypothetical protein